MIISDVYQTTQESAVFEDRLDLTVRLTFRQDGVNVTQSNLSFSGRMGMWAPATGDVTAGNFTILIDAWGTQHHVSGNTTTIAMPTIVNHSSDVCDLTNLTWYCPTIPLLLSFDEPGLIIRAGALVPGGITYVNRSVPWHVSVSNPTRWDHPSTTSEELDLTLTDGSSWSTALPPIAAGQTVSVTGNWTPSNHGEVAWADADVTNLSGASLRKRMSSAPGWVLDGVLDESVDGRWHGGDLGGQWLSHVGGIGVEDDVSNGLIVALTDPTDALSRIRLTSDIVMQNVSLVMETGTQLRVPLNTSLACSDCSLRGGGRAGDRERNVEQWIKRSMLSVAGAATMDNSTLAEATGAAVGVEAGARVLLDNVTIADGGGYALALAENVTLHHASSSPPPDAIHAMEVELQRSGALAMRIGASGFDDAGFDATVSTDLRQYVRLDDSITFDRNATWDNMSIECAGPARLIVSAGVRLRISDSTIRSCEQDGVFVVNGDLILVRVDVRRGPSSAVLATPADDPVVRIGAWGTLVWVGGAVEGATHGPALSLAGASLAYVQDIEVNDAAGFASMDSGSCSEGNGTAYLSTKAVRVLRWRASAAIDIDEGCRLRHFGELSLENGKLGIEVNDGAEALLDEVHVKDVVWGLMSGNGSVHATAFTCEFCGEAFRQEGGHAVFQSLTAKATGMALRIEQGTTVLRELRTEDVRVGVGCGINGSSQQAAVILRDWYGPVRTAHVVGDGNCSVDVPATGHEWLVGLMRGDAQLRGLTMVSTWVGTGYASSTTSLAYGLGGPIISAGFAGAPSIEPIDRRWTSWVLNASGFTTWEAPGSVTDLWIGPHGSGVLVKPSSVDDWNWSTGQTAGPGLDLTQGASLLAWGNASRDIAIGLPDVTAWQTAIEVTGSETSSLDVDVPSYATPFTPDTDAGGPDENWTNAVSWVNLSSRSTVWSDGDRIIHAEHPAALTDISSAGPAFCIPGSSQPDGFHWTAQDSEERTVHVIAPGTSSSTTFEHGDGRAILEGPRDTSFIVVIDQTERAAWRISTAQGMLWGLTSASLTDLDTEFSSPVDDRALIDVVDTEFSSPVDDRALIDEVDTEFSSPVDDRALIDEVLEATSGATWTLEVGNGSLGNWRLTMPPLHTPSGGMIELEWQVLDPTNTRLHGSFDDTDVATMDVPSWVVVPLAAHGVQGWGLRDTEGNWFEASTAAPLVAEAILAHAHEWSLVQQEVENRLRWSWTNKEDAIPGFHFEGNMRTGSFSTIGAPGTRELAHYGYECDLSAGAGSGEQWSAITHVPLAVAAIDLPLPLPTDPTGVTDRLQDVLQDASDTIQDALGLGDDPPWDPQDPIVPPDDWDDIWNVTDPIPPPVFCPPICDNETWPDPDNESHRLTPWDLFRRAFDSLTESDQLLRNVTFELRVHVSNGPGDYGHVIEPHDVFADPVSAGWGERRVGQPSLPQRYLCPSGGDESDRRAFVSNEWLDVVCFYRFDEERWRTDLSGYTLDPALSDTLDGPMALNAQLRGAELTLNQQVRADIAVKLQIRRRGVDQLSVGVASADRIDALQVDMLRIEVSTCAAQRTVPRAEFSTQLLIHDNRTGTHVIEFGSTQIPAPPNDFLDDCMLTSMHAENDPYAHLQPRPGYGIPSELLLAAPDLTVGPAEPEHGNITINGTQYRVKVPWQIAWIKDLSEGELPVVGGLPILSRIQRCEELDGNWSHGVCGFSHSASGEVGEHRQKPYGGREDGGPRPHIHHALRGHLVAELGDETAGWSMTSAARADKYDPVDSSTRKTDLIAFTPLAIFHQDGLLIPAEGFQLQDPERTHLGFQIRRGLATVAGRDRFGDVDYRQELSWRTGRLHLAGETVPLAQEFGTEARAKYRYGVVHEDSCLINEANIAFEARRTDAGGDIMWTHEVDVGEIGSGGRTGITYNICTTRDRDAMSALLAARGNGSLQVRGTADITLQSVTRSDPDASAGHRPVWSLRIEPRMSAMSEAGNELAFRMLQDWNTSASLAFLPWMANQPDSFTYATGDVRVPLSAAPTLDGLLLDFGEGGRDAFTLGIHRFNTSVKDDLLDWRLEEHATAYLNRIADQQVSRYLKLPRDARFMPYWLTERQSQDWSWGGDLLFVGMVDGLPVIGGLAPKATIPAASASKEDQLWGISPYRREFGMFLLRPREPLPLVSQDVVSEQYREHIWIGNSEFGMSSLKYLYPDFATLNDETEHVWLDVPNAGHDQTVGSLQIEYTVRRSIVNEIINSTCGDGEQDSGSIRDWLCARALDLLLDDEFPLHCSATFGVDAVGHTDLSVGGSVAGIHIETERLTSGAHSPVAVAADSDEWDEIMDREEDDPCAVVWIGLASSIWSMITMLVLVMAVVAAAVTFMHPAIIEQARNLTATGEFGALDFEAFLIQLVILGVLRIAVGLLVPWPLSFVINGILTLIGMASVGNFRDGTVTVAVDFIDDLLAPMTFRHR